MKYLKSGVLVLFLWIYSAEMLSAHGNSDLYCRPADPDGRYREHPLDFLHLLLEVSFAPKAGLVQGRATYTFEPIQPRVDSVYLDGPGIRPIQVLLNGKPLRCDSVEGGLVIRFGTPVLWKKKYKLEIQYSALPEKGLYFIGWNDPTNRCRKQIWTQGQGIDNRHWFPCYDDVNDKLITETKIRFDTAYTVISNGPLKSKTLNADGSATWHYAMSKPHVPYLVMLAIGKYAWKDVKAVNGIVSRQYYYPDEPEAFEPTYRFSKEMMEWMPQELGVAYPWQTYANVPVQDFMYGAMENTASTVFTDYYLRDARSGLGRSYVGTNAHELTHQWFGDLITEWSGTHHWLHESFATYYAKHFGRKMYGEDYYAWKCREESMSALSADRRDRYPVAHTKGGSARHYPKGSLVIDMLRYVVGDEIYKETISRYLKKHSFGNVDTHDFWRAFMESSGINLDWFFDEWVYRSGFPVMQVSKTIGKDSMEVRVLQKKDTAGLTAYFTMPLKIQWVYESGRSDSAMVWMKDSLTIFKTALPADEIPDYVLVDPGSRILKEMEYERRTDELMRVALRANHLLDRYDALGQLEDSVWEGKADFLRKVYEAGRHHSLLSQALLQASKMKETEGLKSLLIQGFYNPSPEVRAMAISLADSSRPYLKPMLIEALRDSSFENIEAAMKRLYYHTDSAALPEIRKACAGVSGLAQNVRCSLIELEIKSGDSSRVADLLDMAGPSFEFRTRINAMQSIRLSKIQSPEAVRVLLPAAVHFNGRLASVAKQTLGKMLKDKACAEEARLLKENGEWTPSQIKILEEIIKQK